MKGAGVMRGLDEWEVSGPEVFPAPKPVLYSQVVCRGCGGRTVEVEPNREVVGYDIGGPLTRVTAWRFLCDDCGVMTWRK